MVKAFPTDMESSLAQLEPQGTVATKPRDSLRDTEGVLAVNDLRNPRIFVRPAAR